MNDNQERDEVRKMPAARGLSVTTESQLYGEQGPFPLHDVYAIACAVFGTGSDRTVSEVSAVVTSAQRMLNGNPRLGRVVVSIPGEGASIEVGR